MIDGFRGPSSGRLRRRTSRPAERAAPAAASNQSLNDGVYEIAYIGHDVDGAHHGVLFAILQHGIILGCDRGGCIFTGTVIPSEPDQFQMTLDVPPFGVLVNGYRAGPHGAFLQIEGQMRKSDLGDGLYVTIASEPIEVRLTYMGPLAK